MLIGIMSNRIEKNLEYLKILSKCNNKMRKSIIDNADKELISTICECILNCMNGNINLNEETKLKLKRHKNSLRNLLIKKKISVKKKKNILKQKGGAFLPVLLSTVISGLASLFS